MIPVPLSRIAQWTGGQLYGHGRAQDSSSQDLLIDAVITDTRTFGNAAGDTESAALFVALKGERFDGHRHVAEAAELGVRAALVSEAQDVVLPQIVVADTERALASLAAALQHTRDELVVAITGSNGKTTVKTLLLSILQRVGKTYANPGNRNNEIGLPLSVIDAPENSDFSIYEMGAGQPGDIAYLTAIVRPRVSLVNNVAPAHLERLGSVEGVADTKAAIYDALPADGIAVINADDAFAPYFATRAHGRRQIRFALDAEAEITARDLRVADDRTQFRLITPQGEADAVVPMAGRHNVANALAAAALAYACGTSLQDIVIGLRDVQPVAGRLMRYRLGNGAVLIDDSYNANPGSLNAAIDTLASASGETWLVLGDMRELGVDGQQLHEAAGKRAKEAGIARLYALGGLSAMAAKAFGEGARTFSTHEDLIEALRSELHATVRVLVKGSRGSAMDRIVKALLAADGGEPNRGGPNKNGPNKKGSATHAA